MNDTEGITSIPESIDVSQGFIKSQNFLQKSDIQSKKI